MLHCPQSYNNLKRVRYTVAKERLYVAISLLVFSVCNINHAVWRQMTIIKTWSRSKLQSLKIGWTGLGLWQTLWKRANDVGKVPEVGPVQFSNAHIIAAGVSVDTLGALQPRDRHVASLQHCQLQQQTCHRGRVINLSKQLSCWRCDLVGMASFYTIDQKPVWSD